MMLKLLAGLVSAVLFAAGYSLMNIGNDAVLIFILFFAYSVPVFIVAGTLVSTVVDKLVTGYVPKLAAYSMAGVLFNVYMHS